MKLYRDKRVMKFFEEMGRKGGRIGGAKGGETAASRMSPEQRTARAKKAAAASAKVRSHKAKAQRAARVKSE